MNSTVEDQMTSGHNLDEPHFDEEATILAARPVVPLHEVKAERRSKAGVAVALAIGGGLLIGLLAATLIYRYLGANQVPTGETTTVAEQPASPVGEQTANQLPSSAGGAVAGDDSAVTSVEDQTAAENDTETSERKPEVEESKPVRTQEHAPELAPRRPIVVRESRPPVDENDEAERAIRQAERQEERRERRRAVREARRQERQPNQTADDLTRIREIFEGAPKP